MIEVIPTVVPASLEDIEKAIAMYAPFARTLHIDFADGIFAPNTTWMPGPSAKIVGMEWEAHMMVSDPRSLGLACIKAGASRIIGHIEAMSDESADILEAWKIAGARETGLGILFQTPLESLEAFIKKCDVVQMMTIEKIGVQGLPFAAAAPERVRQMHARYPNLVISVDGGVNEATIAALSAAGAARFCAGSVLSKSADPKSTYEHLIALANSAVE